MKIYQVDAFTAEKFKGNPAAVCLLPDDYVADDDWMQRLAAEMNLSETAFVAKSVKTGGGVFQLRWFTPKTEVDLCGHATLAASHILWEEGILGRNEAALFDTRSGRLMVTLEDTMMTLDFPREQVTPCKEPVGLEMALGCSVLGTYRAGQDLLIEVADEATVVNLKPSFQQLSVLPVRCTIVTAQGNEADFVSRVFGPAVGINEDPVTGSTHCALAPFWSMRLNKNEMKAYQLSERGGVLQVAVMDDRVAISGEAVTIFKGDLCE